MVQIYNNLPAYIELKRGGKLIVLNFEGAKVQFYSKRISLTVSKTRMSIFGMLFIVSGTIGSFHNKLLPVVFLQFA